MTDKIEYLVLLVAAFATYSEMSEAMAYRYLSKYGVLALCSKHYNVMHTLSVEENIRTLHAYCQRKAAEEHGVGESALLSESKFDNVRGGSQ